MLGKENVGIFVFEELKKDPKQYYTRICDFIGVDPEEGYALTQENHLHPRITQGQIDFLRNINDSVRQRMKYIAKGETYRRREFRQHASDEPAQVTISDEWQQRIITATTPSHQWLAEHYQLPLAEYGYPI